MALVLYLREYCSVADKLRSHTSNTHHSANQLPSRIGRNRHSQVSYRVVSHGAEIAKVAVAIIAAIIGEDSHISFESTRGGQL